MATHTIEFPGANIETKELTTTDLKINTVSVTTFYTLENVTNTGNTTTEVVQFTNPTTGLVTTANVDVGGKLTVSGDATVSSNLTVGGTSLVDLIYPLGAIYITTSAVSPSSIWAGTTWVAYGEGRTMIGHGAGAGLTDRPTVEAMGGAETHTLTKAEIPPHVHTERHNTGGGLEYKPGYNAQQEPLDPPDTINIINTGDGSADGLQGQAHNNMQPYIVTYMWKRTA
jgi:hypothetical protein